MDKEQEQFYCLRMQEVPPSPPMTDRPLRRRFLILAISLLFLFAVGTLLMVADLINYYKWADEGRETTWGRGVLMISIWAFLIFKFCIPALLKYWSNAEIERLLPEFVEVSDHFTRPKHFIHKALRVDEDTGYADSFIHQLGAYSDGSLRPPVLGDRSGKKGHINYKVIICIKDKIFPIVVSDKVYNNNGYSYQMMSDVAREAGHEGVDVIHVRITTEEGNSSEQHDDITLEGVRLEAFIKTLELSSQFRANPTSW